MAKKVVKEIYVTFAGDPESLNSSRVHYILKDVQDPRMSGSVVVPMWEDDEVKKLSQALWERCCKLIEKTESSKV